MSVVHTYGVVAYGRDSMRWAVTQDGAVRVVGFDSREQAEAKADEYNAHAKAVSEVRL